MRINALRANKRSGTKHPHQGFILHLRNPPPLVGFQEWMGELGSLDPPWGEGRQGSIQPGLSPKGRATKKNSQGFSVSGWVGRFGYGGKKPTSRRGSVTEYMNRVRPPPPPPPPFLIPPGLPIFESSFSSAPSFDSFLARYHGEWKGSNPPPTSRMWG